MNVEMGIGVGGVRLYGGMGEGCTSVSRCMFYRCTFYIGLGFDSVHKYI